MHHVFTEGLQQGLIEVDRSPHVLFKIGQNLVVLSLEDLRFSDRPNNHLNGPTRAPEDLWQRKKKCKAPHVLGNCRGAVLLELRRRQDSRDGGIH